MKSSVTIDRNRLHYASNLFVLYIYCRLKGSVYLYAPPDHPDRVVNVPGDPVQFLQGESHRL